MIVKQQKKWLKGIAYDQIVYIVTGLFRILSLVHLSLDKLAAILADDILSAFSGMKKFGLLLKLQWSLLLRARLTISLDNGMVPNRRQAIIWANADPIPWRIYAAPGEDEFTVTLWTTVHL